MKFLRKLVGIGMILGAVFIVFYVSGKIVSGLLVKEETIVQAKEMLTPVSSQVTPTMVPTPLAPTPTVSGTLAAAMATPTPVSGPAEDIKFDRGAYGKTLTDATNGPKVYTFWARGGQKISVLLKASGTAWTSLYKQDSGTFLYDKAVGGSTVQGTLPSSGTYTLVVFPGSGQITYELGVEIR